MANVNSVNGNSNGNSSAVLAEKLAATKEAAAAKEATAAEKTNSATASAEKTNAISAVEKSDTVQISEKASTLAGTAKADTTANANAAQNAATPASLSNAKVEATTQQNSTVEKAAAPTEPQDMKSVISAKKSEVKQLRKDLMGIGVEKKEVRHIMKSARKEAYASVKGDIKQLSADYKAKDINKSEMKDGLYSIASKQLDGVISNVTNVYNQKMGFGNNHNGSTQGTRESIFTKTADVPKTSTHADRPDLVKEAAAKNEEKNAEAKAAAKNEEKTAMEAKPAINAKPEITEKSNNGNGNGNGNGIGNGLGQAEKAEKAEKPEKEEGTSKLEKALKDVLKEILKSEKSEEKETPQGLEKKSEGPGNSENASEKIASMFNDIEKMVNDLEKEEKKDGFSNFVSGLKKMFNSGSGVEGNSFLKDLNRVVDEHDDSGTQIKAETLSGLLKGGSTNSAFGVNRVGDNGDGSGNFSAANFTSSMSENVSEGLDSYKDAKDAREESGIEQARQAKAEAEFSTLA